MEPTSALSTSAQIAVAIAGFAGVVAVFRSESIHDWGQVEKFWLRLLLVNSILPLAFSMVGLLSLAIAPDPGELWRWCSGFAVLFLIPYAAMILNSLTHFAPGELEAAGGSRLLGYALYSILIAVCLLQLYNLVVLAAFWPFLASIISLLLGSMYQFVRLVLTPPNPGN